MFGLSCYNTELDKGEHMEFRYQVRQLLKENKTWKQIAELIDLNDEEIQSIAAGTSSYTSGEAPLYETGNKVLIFEDEEEYYFGEIIEVLEKTGELCPEFRYVIKWKDGFTEIFWEQQVMEMISNYDKNQWLL